MFNGLIIATAGSFTQGNPDKNGKNPVILSVIGGTCPNRTVLSGTVAESAGFTVGNTYLAQVKEVEAHPTYGRQFIFTKMKEMDALEIISGVKLVGEARVFDAATNASPASSTSSTVTESHVTAGA